MPIARRFLIPALALFVGIAACESPTRTTAAAFKEAWAATLEIVPPPPSDSSFPSETCKTTLARLREARVALRPPSDDDLVSNSVDLWLQTAQSTFFECVHGNQLRAAYDELDRIETTIDHLLAEQLDGQDSVPPPST
jgi:hypothetical protein